MTMASGRVLFVPSAQFPGMGSLSPLLNVSAVRQDNALSMCLGRPAPTRKASHSNASAGAFCPHNPTPCHVTVYLPRS
jgi:hypothetical protein